MQSLLATILLTLTCFVGVQSQQLRDAIIIETNDVQNTMQAKRVLLGFLGECSNSPSPYGSGSDSSLSNNSFVLDVYKRLTKLEQQYLELNKALSQLSSNACTSSAPDQSSQVRANNNDTLTTTTMPVSMSMNDRVAHKDWNDNRSPADRYADYKYIAGMRPVMWLSAHYYDGFKPTHSSVRTGLVNRRTDVVGNRVKKLGSVSVVDDLGNSAYAFDKSSSIVTTTAVHSQFTLIVAYRYPAAPVSSEGRFFTSSTGNRLFAGHDGCPQRWYIEGWINVNCTKTYEIDVLIGTNDEGVQNLWTYDQHLVKNSTGGINAWGYTVIGQPHAIAGEAARVNVYEAMVFDKVLSAEQRSYVFAVFRKWYNL